MAEKQPANQILNLVVVRYRDGRLVKGVTHDFSPQKKVFHVANWPVDRKKVTEVTFPELKAVFFVKSLEGRKDRPHAEVSAEEKLGTAGSMKMKITFFDGETLIGTTYGYTPEREAFFVVPAEKDSNNLRVFVISQAVKKIETWK